MSKIKEHVNNLFYGLPQTPEVSEAKRQIVEIMEDKYEALTADGMTEMAALGTVISEFGSMEELCAEMNLSPTLTASGDDYAQRQYEQTAWFLEDYSEFKKRFAIGICFGVLTGVVALIWALVFDDFLNWDLVSGLGFMAIGALSAVQFIYWCIQNNRFEMIKEKLEGVDPNKSKSKRDMTHFEDNMNALIFLIAIAIFFIGGVFFGKWHPLWVVFPLALVICGINAVFLPGKWKK